MTAPQDRWLSVRGLELHVRHWEADGLPFVLVHGLASNCLTWEQVARRLHAAGHAVVTVDQRGHGLSSKPLHGYLFEEVAADLETLLQSLQLGQRPVLAGQSWGGNVVLEFAARYPGVSTGLVLVDGGYIELSSRPGSTWESISVELKPPYLVGTPRSDLGARLRAMHPDWSDAGIEHTLGNFETLSDGTMRPWLSLDRHMMILHALWEHHPPQLYPCVTEPVLIAWAESGDADSLERKRNAVAQAQAALARCRVHRFESTDHDIHVHRPEALARVMLQAVADGFFTP